MVLLAGLLMPSRKILGDEFACCEYKQLKPVDPDEDLEAGFPHCENMVKELGGGSCTVDAEIVHMRHRDELETLAIPPGVITVELPSELAPGQLASVIGPHGRRMEVELPIHAQPGGKLHLRLAPQAELIIQLPVEKRPRAQMKVKKANGVEILVTVPEGIHPGGSFQAAPPALMVAVPEESKPGDFVVFRHHEAGPGGTVKTEYCRAQVPDELQFGRYFAARLPKQITAGLPSAKKKQFGILRAQSATKPSSAWVGTLA